ncbi:MAG: hypothetical protein MRY64_03460 [Hyphomonadaceae bacterium]|nr:hypothetical protein [Hyphomonadaceae bacterium]
MSARDEKQGESDKEDEAKLAEDGRTYRDELSKLVFKASFFFISTFVAVCVVLWALPHIGRVFGRPITDVQLEEYYDNFLPTDLFLTTLPIVSGWIGVVLGYYFSDRAAKARGDQVIEATQGVPRLADRLQAIDVTKDMIPLAEIEKVVLSYDGNGQITTPFARLREVVQKPGFTRAPMFKQDKGNYIFQHIAHESVIYRFEAEKRAKGEDPDKMTIQDFLDDEHVQRYIQDTTVFIKRTATLQDAKAAMEGKRGCQDVFVTGDGNKESPVEGWLPNVWILKRSVARADG